MKREIDILEIKRRSCAVMVFSYLAEEFFWRQGYLAGQELAAADPLESISHRFQAGMAEFYAENPRACARLAILAYSLVWDCSQREAWQKINSLARNPFREFRPLRAVYRLVTA